MCKRLGGGGGATVREGDVRFNSLVYCNVLNQQPSGQLQIQHRRQACIKNINKCSNIKQIILIILYKETNKGLLSPQKLL
jgi:hypothetical protein